MADEVLLSAIIPIFNEKGNIKPLYSELKKSLSAIDGDFEIIFVNDGSTDGSEKVLEDIHQEDRRVVVLSHRKTLGKASALGSGFDFAEGKLVITMDGDMQDDPAEIYKFVERISQGYDLVSGRRFERQDALFKILTSRMMNLLVSFLSGIRFYDFYCGFKCYRKETLEKLDLYGGLYRFTPILAHREGLKIAELPIKHHHRGFEKSKYGGIKRFQRAATDLAIILLLIKFRGKGLVAGRFARLQRKREQERKHALEEVFPK